MSNCFNAIKTLVELGYGAYEAHRATKLFADHDRSLFQQLYQTDALEKRISISRQSRDELAKVLAGDKKEQSRRNSDWSLDELNTNELAEEISIHIAEHEQHEDNNK